jgi:hypothetical protein
VIVAIVVVAVLVALVVVMKWADRRDRAKGHVNRSIGEIRSTVRTNRMDLRTRRYSGYRRPSQPPRPPGKKGH